mgnify:CR=1 FL=1
MSHTATAALALRLLDENATGGLVWKTGALTQIAEVLRVDLAGENALRAVDELLRLMSVLRKNRASPAAADALGRMLRMTSGARVLIRTHFGARPVGIDRARNLARREGRAAPLRAPSNNTHMPAGALSARTLIDPSRVDRARAINSKASASKAPASKVRKDNR